MNPRKPRKACRNCQSECKSPEAIYCCQRCQMEFQGKEYIKRWLAGEEDGICGDSLSGYIRTYLKKTRGEKCEQCGWCERNPYSGNIPIEFDHVDGNWTNNKPENLKILCPNCHSLTPTHAGMNKGKGIKRPVYKRALSLEEKASSSRLEDTSSSLVARSNLPS